jgi:hypothetical protein
MPSSHTPRRTGHSRIGQLLGSEHLIIDRQQPTIGATLDIQQRFAEDVLRKST